MQERGTIFTHIYINKKSKQRIEVWVRTTVQKMNPWTNLFLNVDPSTNHMTCAFTCLDHHHDHFKSPLQLLTRTFITLKIVCTVKGSIGCT